MKLKPDQVPTAWRGLEKWLAKVLPEEFRRDAKTVVEIGTDWGFSFWHLLKLFPKATVFSVDPYGATSEGWAGKNGVDAERFVEQWVAQTPRAQMCCDTSVGAAEGWTKPVDFLHIDGRHDYDSVKQDFDAWWPHVRFGGIVAFHDTVSHRGTVGRFVENDLPLSHGSLFASTDTCYGMALWRKDA